MEEAIDGRTTEYPKNKSGQQIAKENVEKVRAYVEGLELRGERVPLRKGRPNWSAIALACGFGRGVFYDNDNARELIERAAQGEKLEPESLDEQKTPTGDKRAAHTQKKLEGSEREVQRLKERLAVKEAEIETLKRENKELNEKLREFSAFEEVMMASGRRYIP